MVAVKLLIADAQLLFAECLAIALGPVNDINVIADHPATAGELVSSYLRQMPDVVIADFRLPPHGGSQACAELLEIDPKAKVLLLSWEQSPGHIQEALQAGTVGFLPKTLSVHQVAEAARRAQAGEPLVYAEELADLTKRLSDRLRASASPGHPTRDLSARELEVLSLLALGQPVEVIMKELSLAYRTVSNHIHKILSKLGARSQLEAVAIARTSGLLDPGPHGPERKHPPR